jgi:hypothetical protein
MDGVKISATWSMYMRVRAYKEVPRGRRGAWVRAGNERRSDLVEPAGPAGPGKWIWMVVWAILGGARRRAGMRSSRAANQATRRAWVLQDANGRQV